MKGDEGVFDVFADGHLVFSKHEKGRFPKNSDEVIAQMARHAKT